MNQELTQKQLINKICSNRRKRKGILLTQEQLNKVVTRYLQIGVEQMLEGYSWELVGTDIVMEITKKRLTQHAVEKLLRNPYYKNHNFANIDFMFSIAAHGATIEKECYKFKKTPAFGARLRNERINTRKDYFLTR